MMTADDLRRLLDAAVAELSADEIPHGIGLCAAASARLTARLVARDQVAESATRSELVNAKRMAAILDVPEGWLRDRQRADQIPCIRVGHYVRFEPGAVLDAVRRMPRLHNSHLRSIKKAKETRGGKRPVSTGCPSSPPETAPEAANG
jgi:hypothetical protein